MNAALRPPMTTPTPRSASQALYRRRGAINALALALACAAAAFGLAFLGWILWTLIAKGFDGLDLALFTQDQPPPLEAGARDLDDAAAWFGYVGDAMSLRVTARVGYVRTSHRYLIAKWFRDLPADQRQAWVDEITRIGTF